MTLSPSPPTSGEPDAAFRSQCGAVANEPIDQYPRLLIDSTHDGSARFGP
jgi:hypothetical protein